MTEPLTKQEMFNRAVRGLASQGYQRCMDDKGCVYTNAAGQHCAWGWVDQDLPAGIFAAISGLRNDGIGVAASLNCGDLHFAEALQEAHDYSDEPDKMRRKLHQVGDKYGLTWPEDVAL